MYDRDGIVAPATGVESDVSAPDEPDEEPEAPYRPLLAAEERAELLAEWLDGLAPA